MHNAMAQEMIGKGMRRCCFHRRFAPMRTKMKTEAEELNSIGMEAANEAKTYRQGNQTIKTNKNLRSTDHHHEMRLELQSFGGPFIVGTL